MATSAEVAESAYEAGRLIGGRFRIEEPLARGGMGAVYRAHDERAGRGVALKQLLLPLKSRNPLLEAQFEREFYTLSQLAHPSIIEVYDYGVEAGCPYYTMELLQGEDLRQRGKLPWRDACAVLCDVASSLAILHSRRLLHRDISARNVFCTSSGRAKLIDFGVMSPMGVSKHVVGTPPFVPPESLQMQALDGRADLYSLGALAYWTLSGAYAYPARTMSELTALLRVPPPPLRQYESDVPEALEALIMQLLQIDRAARPHTAAEVMERLSGIAGLPVGERIEVGKAYLVTPVLTGRDDALERTRSDLRAGREGDGSTLLFEGTRGAGRSRVLDAAVLEAKLMGAIVLRADPADAAAGDYGVARALCAQLHAALPQGFEQGTPSLRPSSSLRPLLSAVQESFRSAGERAFAGERRHVHAALNEWFLSVARERHLVIAIDDVDRIDEPSAAVLGALSHGARRRRLNLMLTAEAGNTPNAGLGLLRQIGRTVPLAPLDAAQVEQLLRSLFGDVPHVAGLAARVFGSSRGVPGWTMTLVEHLVESGSARYEAGTWALPAQLQAEQLPRSLALAQIARLSRLAPDARGLAEAMSLIDGAGLTPPDYPALTEHRDHGRTYTALEALLASGVLVVAGDRHRFSAPELRSALRDELSAERRHALHARIAEVLAGTELATQRPMHMLLGGREREAIAEIMERYTGRNAVVHSADDVELLERAVQSAARLQLPLPLQLELQLQRLNAVALVGDRERFLRHAPDLLQRAVLASGLSDFDPLGSGTVAERMAEARVRAQQRYDALPEAERGWAPGDLQHVLPRIYGTFLAITAVAQELSIVERLPALDPLFTVWPALSVMQAYVDIACGMQRGHHGLVSARARGLLDYMEQHGELPDALVRPVRLGQLFTLGLFAATSGRAEARELVAEHEHLPVYRVNAWRVRMVYELMLGNVQGAAQCQRRAELLYLQDSGQAQGPSVTHRIELIAHIYSDDLIGVKRSIDVLAELTTRYPGWASTLSIARCQYRRLRGDPAGAFEALQPALQHTLPGCHMDWWLVAYSHVQVLSELGRPDEAASYGRRCIEIWTEGNYSPIDYGLRQVTAEALLRAGQVPEARAMIDAYIETHVAAGTHGLRLGLAYETRTRVAIAEQDEQAVQLYSRFCAQEYKGGRHFGLLTKYSRLLRDVDAGGISVSTGLRQALDPSVMTYPDASQTLQSMLMGCVDATELAHTGLRALLQSSDVECGYLFLLRAGRLQRMAAAEASDAETPGLPELLEQCLQGELEHEIATGQDDLKTASRLEQRWRDSRGREFEPVLLSGKQGGHSVAVGMAAVQTDRDRRPVVRRVLIETLCQSLLAERAADPIRLR